MDSKKRKQLENLLKKNPIENTEEQNKLIQSSKTSKSTTKNTNKGLTNSTQKLSTTDPTKNIFERLKDKLNNNPVSDAMDNLVDKVFDSGSNALKDIGNISKNFALGVKDSAINVGYFMDRLTNSQTDELSPMGRINKGLAIKKANENEMESILNGTYDEYIENNYTDEQKELMKTDPIKFEQTKYSNLPSTSLYQESANKILTEDEKKIQENIENSTNKVSKKVAELTPSIAQSVTGLGVSALNPYLGAGYFVTSAGGSYIREGQAKGMTDEQANTYGTIMGAMEGITEVIGGELTKGVGKAFFKEGAGQGLKALGLDIGENFFEEAIMEPIQQAVTSVVGGEADWSDMGSKMFQSGLDGALTSILMGGASAGIGSALNVAEKLKNGENVSQDEIVNSIKEVTESGKVDVEKIIKENFQNVETNTKLEEKQAQETKTEEVLENNQQTIQEETKTAQNSNTEQIEDVTKNEQKSTENGQKSTENEYEKVLEEAKFIPQEEKESLLKDSEGTTIEDFKYFVEQENNIYKEENDKILDTTKTYSTGRKETYSKYMQAKNEYDTTAIESAKETIQGSKKAGGRRTKEQWLQVANLLGTEIADKSNSEIEEIAYRTWQDERPNSKSSINRQGQNYVPFNSDEWINEVYNAVKKARGTIENNSQKEYNISKEENYGGKENDGKTEESIGENDNNRRYGEIYTRGDTTKLGEQINKYNKDENSDKSSFSLQEKPTKESIIQDIYDNVENRTSKDNQKNNKRIEEFLKEKYPNYSISFTNYKSDGTVKINAIQTIEEKQNTLEEIYKQNEENKKKFEKEKSQNAYKTTPINSEDEYHLTRGKLPSTEQERNNLEDIRNKTQNLVDELKQDGYYLYYDESKASADAMYIDVFTDDNSDSYVDTIRIANHYKLGVSGQYENDIDMSEYTSKSALIKDIKETIDEVKNGNKAQEIENAKNEENLEKKSNTEYNDFESEVDENGTNTRRKRTNMGRNNGESRVLKNSKQEQERKYREWELSIITKSENELTKEERKLKESIKNKYHKEIYFIKSDNEKGYNAGASLSNENILYINSEKSKEYGLKRTALHEVMESNIRFANEQNKDIIISAINDLISDKQVFDKQKVEFLLDQESNASDTAIAKDIICDRFAQLKGEKLDYTIYPETQNKIDMAIEYFNNQNENSNKSSFSLQKDNQGRTLSKEQQEYFKDSKVKDENGNLLTMYHSTDADFNEFTYDNLGKTGTAFGEGFYFTDSEKAKNAYGQNTKIVYLDIKKPMEIGKTTMSKKEYQKLAERINEITEGRLVEDYGSMKDILMDYDYGGDDIDLINGLKNVSGLGNKEFYNILRDTIGFDGIKANNKTNGIDGNYWIAFNSNQIKDVNNTNPTTNPNILKEEFIQLSIEGFNNPPENNLSNKNWKKYAESQKETNKILNEKGTKISIEKRKFAKDFIDKGYIDLNGIEVKTIADMADISQIFRNPKYETFRVIYTNGNNIVGQEAVSSRAVGETSVFINKEEGSKGFYRVKDRMKRLNADGYYLIHNHPSGSAVSSSADINTTQIFSSKVSGFKGHIIVNSGTYAYIDSNFSVNDNVPIINYSPDEIDKMMSSEPWANTQITRKSLVNIAYDVKNNPNYSTLIIADTSLKGRIILDIPNSFFNMSNEQINGYIRNVARENGGLRAFVATQDSKVFNRLPQLRTIQDSILYNTDSNGEINVTSNMIVESGDVEVFYNYTSKSSRVGEKTEDYNIYEELPKRKIVDEVYREEINEGKTRKHYKSVFESDQIGEVGKEVAKELYKTDTYTPISNESTLADVNTRIATSGVEESYISFIDKIKNNDKTTLQDIAMGERLIQIYSQNGDIAKVNELIQDVAMLGTELGQQVQALSLIKKASPEGQLQYLHKLVDRTNQKENTQIEITDDMAEQILQSRNEKELQENMTDIAEAVANEIPITTKDKIRSWRYLAMLGNPKTHIKNVGANVFMNLTQQTKNKIAGGIEDVTSVFKKDMQRTKTLKGANEEQIQFAKDDAEIMQDLIDGGGKYDIQNIVQSSKRQFDNNTLNSIAEFNSNMLDKEDKIFLKLAYKQALQGYMSANNLKASDMQGAVLEKARQYASLQAQEATFHQFNAMANTLNQVEKKGGILGKVVEAVLPFKKTPLNIAKEGLEYSPVGLLKTLTTDLASINSQVSDLQTKLDNKKITQEEFEKGKSEILTKQIDSFSKGLTGTSIAVLGFFLAKAGLLKAGNDGDDDEFEEQLGNQEYSIKLGDNTYTLDWISPSAMPLFTGATIYDLVTGEQDVDKDLLNNVTTAFAKMFEPMTEMSMLQGLTSAISSYEQGSSNMIFDLLASAGTSYLGQFVPTALGQVAKTIDPYERNTTSTKTGISKKIDQLKNQTIAKLPGLTYTLPVKKDVWGNDKEKAENPIQRFLEVTVLPYNRKKVIEDLTDKELLNVFEDTGENSVLPSTTSLQKKLTINSESYRLTSEEYNESKQIYGTTSKELLNDLLDSKEYKSLDNDGKLEAIESVYDYAKEKVKVEYAEKNNIEIDKSTNYKNISELLENGGDVSAYLNYKGILKDIDAGNGDDTLKNKEKLQYLNNLKTDDTTKSIIYEESFKDKTYQSLKTLTGKISITPYLEYKQQDIKGDEDTTSTKKGATISGTKKENLVNYLANSKLTLQEQCFIKGTSYKLTESELEVAIQGLNKLSTSEQNTIKDTLSKNFIKQKDGTYKVEYYK